MHFGSPLCSVWVCSTHWASLPEMATFILAPGSSSSASPNEKPSRAGLNFFKMSAMIYRLLI